MDIRTQVPSPAQRIYLPAVDGLRFFAFFGVLLNHIAAPQEIAPLYALQTRGWVGVELFFIISAFLFFTLFRIERERTGRLSIRDFFIRRILRLYPLMIIGPIIFMVAMRDYVDLGKALHELGRIATFTDNLVDKLDSSIPFTTPLWTLSFEFQIYLVLPFLFLLLVRVGTGRFLALLGAILAICIPMRSYYALFDQIPHPYVYLRPWLRPDSVIAGIVIAILAARHEGHKLLAAGVFVASAVAFMLIPNVDQRGAGVIFIYPAAALMCGSLLWLALKVGWLTRFFSSPVLVFLGKRSFGLYVFHESALYLTEREILPRLPWLVPGEVSTYFATLVLTLALTTVMATISYQVLEKPFLLLKDRRVRTAIDREPSVAKRQRPVQPESGVERRPRQNVPGHRRVGLRALAKSS